jgi:hypothetical protein
MIPYFPSSPAGINLKLELPIHITTLLSNLLLHILQKEKIATKIVAKIARVNGP